MRLDKKKLLEVIPTAPVDDINDCIERFGITSTGIALALVAQMAHESGNFAHYVENLNYSASGLASVFPSRFRNAYGYPNALALSIARQPEKIANVVYANRMGNGDSASGDGWKYRGRGAVQLTGKTNYTLTTQDNRKYFPEDSDVDFVKNPELLSTHKYAVRSAFLFFHRNGIDKEPDFKRITQKINGGLNGYEQRLLIRKRLRTKFGLKV